MIDDFIFRVKLKRMSSVRERLVGIGVNNFIGQYRDGLDEIVVQLLNEKNVSTHTLTCHDPESQIIFISI